MHLLLWIPAPIPNTPRSQPQTLNSSTFVFLTRMSPRHHHALLLKSPTSSSSKSRCLTSGSLCLMRRIFLVSSGSSNDSNIHKISCYWNWPDQSPPLFRSECFSFSRRLYALTCFVCRCKKSIDNKRKNLCHNTS